jgi:hypothetical protein
MTYGDALGRVASDPSTKIMVIFPFRKLFDSYSFFIMFRDKSVA